MDLHKIKKAYREKDEERERLRKKTPNKVWEVLKNVSEEVTFKDKIHGEGIRWKKD